MPLCLGWGFIELGYHFSAAQFYVPLRIPGLCPAAIRRFGFFQYIIRKHRYSSSSVTSGFVELLSSLFY